MTRLTGTINRERINIGSKSEHDATVLKTGDGQTLSLRLVAQPAFDYKPFEPLVGQRVEVEGAVRDNTLFIKDLRDVILINSPPPPAISRR